MSVLPDMPLPRLSMTPPALAEALRERFGGRIADAVLAVLAVEDPVPLGVVEQAVAMALDAELAVAGSHFLAQMPMSALTNSLSFQRAARQAGVPVDRLDTAQRLRIDAAFMRRWQTRAGPGRPAHDLEHAQATMASVLLEELS